MDLRRSINTKIWADEWFEGLEPETKLVWLYLLTNQYTNMVGIYEITMKRISFETGVSPETLRKAFEGFERVGKAYFIKNHVVLTNWMKNQSMNTNMEKAAFAQWEKVPLEVKKALSGKGFEGFESLSKGLVILPKKEKEKEKEIEKESEREMQKGSLSPEGSWTSEENEAEFSGEDEPGLPDLDAETGKEKKVAPKKRKLTQFEILQQVVLPFDTPEFREAWELWLQYRSDTKKPYATPISMQQALRELSNYTEEIAIESIHRSLAAGWQGLFPKSIYHEQQKHRKIGQARVNHSGKGIDLSGIHEIVSKIYRD